MPAFRRLNPFAIAPVGRVEQLESREVPAAFTVTNTNDAGAGSLRQAVLDANAMAGADTIVFQAGLTGPITLATGEMKITGPVELQGPGKDLVTVNGNAASRIFNINDGATGAIIVSISGLSLTNGKTAAGQDGGAILLADETLTLRGMLISNNVAADDGGGIGNINDGGTLNVFDSTVSGNKSTGGGGGGIHLLGSGTIRSCVISGNTAGNDGGGLYWDTDPGDTLTITNSTISGNTADEGGGALYANGTGGALTIRDTTISGNLAGDSAGGLYLSHTGSTLIERSTISGNAAANGDGGGINVDTGTLTIRNSTISGNTAQGQGRDGGGVYINATATVVIENTTIVLNTTTDQGGGVFENATTNPVLRNTLIANNTGTTNPDVSGQFDAGGSLIRTPGAAVINAGGGPNLTGVAPLLGPLADNGGPTQTHALQPGSPAIGAGVNALVPTGLGGTTTDQRGTGFVRIAGTVDIGAFEVQPPVPLIATGSADGKAVLFTPSDTGTYPNTPAATITPFGSIGANLRVAAGDVNGDGFVDTIAVTGPGNPIRVGVISGADNTTVLVAPFDPFGGDFTGGGFVAVGDIDKDGKDEFVVTPDQGGGPRVSIFTRNADGSVATKSNFFGIDDPAFRGGARAALGDVNRDGTVDLAVTAGFLGGPRAALFNGTTILTATPTRLVGDFFAFPGADAQTLRNGSFVAAGDVTGDGFADLIFGGGPGGSPRVFILSGQLVSAGNVAGAQAVPVANFFVAGNSTDRGGVRLAVTDADRDARADVVTGSGEGSPANARVYLGKNFTTAGEPATFQDLTLFGGGVLPGGVFVG
jgi:hypothetical protein